MLRADPQMMETIQRELIARGLQGTDSPHALAGLIREVAGVQLPDTQVYALLRELSVSTSLLGPVSALVADPAVTDVVINGPEQVWIDRGNGMERTGVVFSREEELRLFATRRHVSNLRCV